MGFFSTILLVMNSETYTLFFALLAVSLSILVVAVGLFAIVDRSDRFGVVGSIQSLSLELAAAVAITATAGSLFFSSSLGFVPCSLCWVQRGFMYPAAFLLTAGFIGRKVGSSSAKKMANWAIGLAGVLAGFGFPVSVYHRVDQAVERGTGFCDAVNPCSSQWVNHFGFMTIPTMAGIAFVGIGLLVGLFFWGHRISNV